MEIFYEIHGYDARDGSYVVSVDGLTNLGDVEDRREHMRLNSPVALVTEVQRYAYCCGEVMADGGYCFTCERCGSDYNSLGQKLGPREQWGEETGESYVDLVGPKPDSEDVI